MNAPEVFLSYNSADRPSVIAVQKMLIGMGLDHGDERLDDTLGLCEGLQPLQNRAADGPVRNLRARFGVAEDAIAYLVQEVEVRIPGLYDRANGDVLQGRGHKRQRI